MVIVSCYHTLYIDCIGIANQSTSPLSVNSTNWTTLFDNGTSGGSRVVVTHVSGGLASLDLRCTTPLQRFFGPRLPRDIVGWPLSLSFPRRLGLLATLILLRLCCVGDQGRPTDPHMSRASAIPFFLGPRLSSSIVKSVYQ